MSERLCSISIDLDPLRCYYEIHALGEPPPSLQQVILRRALPRFVELFARRGLHATFFVVGADLDVEGANGSRTLLGEMARAGHEIGNHSYAHRYDMARMPDGEVAEDVRHAHRRIAEVAGRAPVGFRAPGYDLSPAMLDVLASLTYSYDSSMFPAPLYWAAKAAVMGAMALAGRPSGSAMSNPRALVAPILPYRPDSRSPWRRGQAPLVELPVTVSPRLRLPVIATSVLLAPTAVRARLLESVRRQPFFNFELHGIDLIDADEDGIPAELVARQPDLRAPLLAKRRALEATLDRIAMDFRFATLREVATVVHREGHVG